MLHKQEVMEFWNGRAGYGQYAGTNDFMLKELEERTITQQIPNNAHVLDVGCGNGSTLIRLVQERECTGVGIDYAEKLLDLAKYSVTEKNLSNSLSFFQGNVLELGPRYGLFNHIITQRCLINLESKEEQKEGFNSIINRLAPGGYYYMIEAFNDGNRELNSLRSRFGLEPMGAPWHNIFFELSDVLDWQKSFPVEVQMISHFASTYYLLSRVVYSKLAADQGKELQYDSDINKLSLDLPPLGEFGATKMIIWKRL